MIEFMVDGLRERKKQATRRAISDAATELFMKKGFDNTSVAEVAEVVSVSPQTVLNYFPTKTDLFFDEENWFTEPPRAVRERPSGTSAARAVLQWYLADLQRRHTQNHLDELAVYLDTIANSEALRRRRLDDLAGLASALRSALKDASPQHVPWDAPLAAAVLTGAIMVAESETARLSQSLSGTALLRAAQASASAIFERIEELRPKPQAGPHRPQSR
jgi:AcrR family transcriptional regulator